MERSPEYIRSYEEPTSEETAKDLAESVWGEQFDTTQMEQDGLDPADDMYSRRESRYRNWDVVTEDAAVVVTKGSHEYVFDPEAGGFLRIIVDKKGRTMGVSETMIKTFEDYEEDLPVTMDIQRGVRYKKY